MQDTPVKQQSRPYFMRQASGGFHEGYLTSFYHAIDPETGKLLLDLHSGPQINHFQTQAYAGIPTRWGPIVDQSEYGHIPRYRIKSDQLYLHNPRSNRGPFVSNMALDMPIQAFESLPNARKLARGLNDTTSFAESELVYPQNLFQTEEEFQRFLQDGRQNFVIALRDLARLLDQERSNPAGEENVRNILKDMEIVRQRQSTFEATMSQLHAAMLARDTQAVAQAQKEAQELVSKQKEENTTIETKDERKDETKDESQQPSLPVKDSDGQIVGSLPIGATSPTTHPRIGGTDNPYFDDYQLWDITIRRYRAEFSQKGSNDWLNLVFSIHESSTPGWLHWMVLWSDSSMNPSIKQHIKELQKNFQIYQSHLARRPDVIMSQLAKKVLHDISVPVWINITNGYMDYLQNQLETIQIYEGEAADQRQVEIDLLMNALIKIQAIRNQLKETMNPLFEL